MQITGAVDSTAAMAQHGSITMARRAQDQQKLEGKAAVGLILAAGAMLDAPPAADGTGRHVDVRV